MDLTQIARTLESFEERFDRLEARVARLEQGSHPAEARTQVREQHQGSGRASATVSSIFNGIALVCFSLLGALILRIATTRGSLAPSTGTSLGLVYAALLVVLPAFVALSRSLKAYGPWLQYCGVTLFSLIVLETTHRGLGMTVLFASLSILVAGVVFILLGATLRRPTLAVFAVLAAIATLAGLGTSLEATSVRAVSALVIILAGLLAGHWRDWPSLRVSSLISGSLVLGIAVLATGRRLEVPRSDAWTVFAALAVLWGLSVGNHLVQYRRSGGGEASWLPVMTLWTGALTIFFLPQQAGSWGSAVAAVLWGLSLAAGRRSRQANASLNGLGAGATVATVLFFQRIDPTGIAMLGAAFCAFLVWKWAGGRLLRATLILLALGATGTAVFKASLLHAPAAGASSGWWHGLSLAILLLILWQLTAHQRSGSRSEGTDWAAILILVCASICLLGTSRAIAILSGAKGGLLSLVESVTLGLLACAALLHGWWRSCNESVILGLMGVGLFLAMLLLRDVFTLSPAQLAVDVIALGASCVVASRVWRAHALRRGGPAETNPPS